jgi:hypothetical protein
VLTLLGEPEPVRAADSNLDFRVTAAEWTAKAGQRFETLDLDHDGRLLFAELKPLGAGAGRVGARRVDQGRRGR